MKFLCLFIFLDKQHTKKIDTAQCLVIFNTPYLLRYFGDFNQQKKLVKVFLESDPEFEKKKFLII